MVENLTDLTNSFLEEVTGHDITEEGFDRNELYIRWLQKATGIDSRDLTDLQNSLFLQEDSEQFSDYFKHFGFSGSLESMKRSFFSGTVSFYTPMTKGLDNSMTGGVSVFDGVDDFIELTSSNSIITTSEFIIEMKLNVNGFTGSPTSRPLNLHRGTSAGTALNISIDGGGNLFVQYYDGASFQILNSLILSLDTDYIIKIVRDSTSTTLFVNEIEYDSIVGNMTTFGTYPCFIGNETSTSSRLFNGIINYVKIDSDVTQTNLVAHYDLRDNATLGTDNVIDLSGNGNHGTSYGKNVFTRTTTGTYTDGNGIIRLANTDQARHQGGGFKIEPGNDGIVSGGVSITGDGSMKFDGVDGMVVADTNISSYPFTLECEVIVNNTSITEAIFGLNDASNIASYYRFYHNNDKFAISARNTTEITKIGTTTINEGQKYKVKVIFHSDTSRELFIDDIFEVEDTVSVTFNSEVDSMVIGVPRVASPFGYLDGTINNAKIWDDATQDNLVAHYSGEHYEGTRTEPTKILDIKDADFDVTYEGDGLLIEEQRTNLFLNSSVPITQTITITNATVYTLNVIGTGSITLSGGGTGTATEGTPITFTSSSTSVTCTVTGSLDYAQLEAGSMPTSMIITEGTAVTRTVDVCSYDMTDKLTQGQGSLYTEFNCLGIDDGYEPRVLELTDNTSSNNISIQLRHTTKVIRTFITTGGVEQTAISSVADAVSFNTQNKVLLTYEDNNIKLYFNGVKIGEDLSGTIPVGLFELSVGNKYNSTSQLNGTVKNVKYSKEVIGEAEAIQMTK